MRVAGWVRGGKNPLRLTGFLTFCLALFAPLVPVMASNTDAPSRFDRSPYLAPDAVLSDDVRRVPQAPEAPGLTTPIVLVGGRIFDGTGSPAREGTLVLQDHHVSEVLPSGTDPGIDNALVIDVTGKWVMPGLIDLHTHLTYVERFGLPAELSDENLAEATLRAMSRMRRYVLSGVTSVRDVASHGSVPFALKRWQQEGRLEGPRVFAAGQLIVGRGGHGTEGFVMATAPDFLEAAVIEASGPDEWRDAVRLQFKRGADWIKLASHYSPEEVEAAVSEAHALGLPVTVDAETQYIDMAIAAGVDSIEHPLPRSERALQEMAKQHIAAVPTLIPYQMIIRQGGGYFGSTSRRFTLTEDSMMGMLKDMRRRGIQVGVGTDLVVDWIKYMPQAYINELKNLEAAGYSPRETLAAATSVSADILKMGDRLGRLEPGMLADVIVVDGDPERQLEDLARLSLVIVNGSMVARDGELVPWRDAHFAP